MKKPYKGRQVDFSSEINPKGVPQKAKVAVRKAVKNSDSYPDNSCTALKNALARFHGINTDSLICTSGTTELIYLIMRALKPEQIITLSPVNPHIHRASEQHGAIVRPVILDEKNDFLLPLDKLLTSFAQCDMLFLTNPHEPVGQIIPQETIKALAEQARLNETFLVVDESLIDFCDNDETLVKDAPIRTHTLVLRSFSQFYALAGLRVGYGVAHKEVIRKLSFFKDPWTVSSVAQAAARAVLRDKRYRNETKDELKNEKTYLIKELKSLGFTIFNSHGNFFLVKGISKEMKMILHEKGYMIPEFIKDYDTITKIFVQKHVHNVRLIKTLRSILV